MLKPSLCLPLPPRARESTSPFERTVTGPDGTAHRLRFAWTAVNFGGGDRIDRWTICFVGEHKQFFATFATRDEAVAYVAMWANGNLCPVQRFRLPPPFRTLPRDSDGIDVRRGEKTPRSNP